MKSGEFIIAHHHPWRHRLLIGGAWLGAVVAGWGFYAYGQYQGGYDVIEASKQRLELHGKLREIESERDQLRIQLAALQQGQVIDQQSYGTVRGDLKQLQEEILELRKEVEFYRGIASPTERQGGIAIQSFKVQPAGEGGLYRFELVITQVLNNGNNVAGNLRLALEGTVNGQSRSIDFSEISLDRSVKSSFRFRYFDKISGDIRLPPGFIARNVHVEVAANGRKSVEKNFAWPAG
ncbi:MAG: hypothetical protein HY272_13665 [Gammaproteobacteria bacterium]|nr:hypothetical protein [Gammaproteobacteria bacterium]